jgi:tetratricopeptide (TPR) repeat protein
MSFEDDEYWESEYSDRSPVSYGDNTAIARDRYAERPVPPDPDRYAARRPAPPEPDRYAARRPAPPDPDRYAAQRPAPADPGPPGRRSTAPRTVWDDTDAPEAPDPGFAKRPAPDPGVDELAARRKRRGTGRRGSAKRQRPVQEGFDTERPGWLDDPDFVPIDVSAPDLAGPESAILDFNRPELGAGFDAPEFAAPPAARGRQRRSAPRVEDDDWDDEIDEPYDHRTGMDRRSTVRGLDGYVRPADDRDRLGDEEFERTTRPDAGRPNGRPDARRLDADRPESVRTPAARTPTARPATGRARVPQPSVDQTLDPDRRYDLDGFGAGEEFGYDDRPAARGRVAPPSRGAGSESFADPGSLDDFDVAAGPDSSVESDGLPDLYWRPAEQRRPDDPPQDAEWPDQPTEAEAGAGRGVETADDARGPAGTAPGRDGPQVVSRGTPPATPRIKSKASPPPAPKVIKKADPPPQPRVIGVQPAPVQPKVAAPGPTSPAGSPAPAAGAGPAAPAAPPARPPAPTTAPPIRPARPPAAPSARPPTPTEGPPPGAGAAAAPDPPASGPDQPQSPDPTDDASVRAGQPPSVRPAPDTVPRTGPSPAPRPAPPGIGDPAAPPPHDRARGARPPAGRPRVAAVAPDGVSGELWEYGNLPPLVLPRPVPTRSAAPRDGRPPAAPPTPHGPQPHDARPPAPPPSPAAIPPSAMLRSAPQAFAGQDPRPVSAPQPRPASQPVPRESMPTADLSRRPPRPQELPPLSPPAQVRPRVEPTPINGYPAAYAANPAAATPPAPLPGERGATPPAPQAPRPRDEHATPPVPNKPESGDHRTMPLAAHGSQPGDRRTTPSAPDAPEQGQRRLAPPSSGQVAATDPPPNATLAPEGRTPAGTEPVPIAKLAVSGPDLEPRRYADANISDSWFTTKPDRATPPQDSPPADSAAADSAAADRATRTPAGDEAATSRKPSAGGGHAEGRSAPAGGDASDATTGSHAAAAGPSAAGIPMPTTGGPQADGAEPSGDASGVVINVDLTGLLNGMTAAQAIIVPRDRPPAESPQRQSNRPPPHDRHAEQLDRDRDHPDDRAGNGGAHAGVSQDDAGDDGDRPGRDEVARSLVMPGPAPAEPAPPTRRPRRPLGAADLEAIRWRLDGATLREVVDDREALRELGARLDEPLSAEADHVTRAGVLSARAEVYRLLGELGMAAAASRLALAHAESAQDVQATVIAEAELAHVLRLRGDFAEADRLFEEAASSEAPKLLRSVVHENAGRSCFDQGRHMEALDHFARAIRLGAPDDLDLVERIGVCLQAVYIHVLRDGWGPYPRLRNEILGQARPAEPSPDGPPPVAPQPND